MKFVTIIGARPQFIKAAPLSAVLRLNHSEFLVHTGQHYDSNMSDVFFSELNIPCPDKYLGVGSGSHGAQTAAMLASIEQVLLDEKPDAVIIYGDTNSTVAGALAAVKLHLPVGHVEAGLRSFNRDMPEEINRIVADHISTWLFCPSSVSVRQLASEGVVKNVYDVGDIMADSVRLFAPLALEKSPILSSLTLKPLGYAVATIHRASNTDDPAKLKAILDGLLRAPYPVVLPLHPRTRAALKRYGLQEFLNEVGGQLTVIEPVGYLDMLQLQQNAAVVLTDSGGIQKEAYYLGVPCVTLREETEWVETVETGWNQLIGTDMSLLPAAVEKALDIRKLEHPKLYGDGYAAERIVERIA
jgi:UDP-N-acetylglucosamine 2-epimerase